MNIEVRYDPERQLLYVRLRKPEGSIERTEDLGGDRYVDYDQAGNVVGIEFLAIAQDGLDLAGLPDADRIAQALNAIPRPVTPVA